MRISQIEVRIVHFSGGRVVQAIQVSSCEELAKALEHAVPGTTIDISDGLYDREEPFVLRAQSTPEAPITIRAASQGKAVFTGRSSWVFDSSSYVVSEGTNERKRVPRNPLTAAEVGPDAP